MPLIEGVVGSQSISDGVPVKGRFDRDAGLLVSELRGRYTEMATRGKVFMASLAAGVALSTLSTTATGFILTNPVGSGKNIALLYLAFTPTTAPAGAAPIGLCYGPKSTTAVTQTTPLTVRSGLLEAYSGVGLAASAATLPIAPVFIAGLNGPVATANIQGSPIVHDLGGMFVIPPGSNLSLSYLTTAISVLGGMVWAEHDA